MAVDQEFASGLTMRQNESIRERLREEGKSAEDQESLQQAKHQIALAIQELMASRKQRQRRQAAALRGISSNKPEPAVIAPTKAKPVKTPRPNPKLAPSPPLPESPPTPAYSSFQLKR
jgi:putative transposase